MVESKTIVSRLAKVAIIIVLIASALMCFLPLMNVFALSLSSNTAALAGEVMFWPVISPSTPMNTWLTAPPSGSPCSFQSSAWRWACRSTFC